jgi:DNA-binding NarL/FixJ family response regulator
MSAGVWRVAVVTGHPIVREGIIGILEAAGDIAVVVSSSAAESLRFCRVAADVVILELDSGAADLDAVQWLSRATRVVAVSGSGRPADLLAAREAGASGYVGLDADQDAYLTAVRSVARGETFIAGRLLSVVPAGLQPGRAALSRRERETLSYIARGFTHAQTATRMRVSKATVDTYIARIRAKLNLGNKAELALAAVTHGLPHTG